MADIVQEDAGPFTMPAEYQQETRRRVNSVTKERRRTSSVRSENAIFELKNDTEDIVISPEDIPDEYEHNTDHQGLFILFNHEEFPLHDSRTGTQKDQNDLVECLSRLRYEIRKEFLCKDFTKEQIEEQLLKIARMDHTKRSSLIVVFLTHGDADGKLYCWDGRTITCEEVWSFFSADKCPTLKGKPKIFLFQACKGKQKSKVPEGIQEDSIVRTDVAKKNYTLPAEADFLVAYSTLEGNVSYRHTLDGSWFIQELCKNFSAYGRRDDIVTILTRVSKCVAYHYQHHDCKQMPSFISTLTRKFYLCKSKERGFMYDIFTQNTKLLEKVELLQKQIDELYKKDKQIKDQEDSNMKKQQPIRKVLSKSNLSERPRWKS